MSTSIPQRLNERLSAIFDTDDDVYKVLVSDPSGTPEVTITKPTDFNHGALASVVEWTDELKKGLVDMLRLDLAEGAYLRFHIYDFLQEQIFAGETDEEAVARIAKYYHGPKVSNAAILDMALEFSTPGLPEIKRHVRDILYCDVGYCDSEGPEFFSESGDFEGDIATPGYTGDLGASTAYGFTLVLENFDESKIDLLLDHLDRWIAAGIDAEVELKTVA